MFGKLKIKDNANLTNKKKDVINFHISRRIRDESIIDEISTVYITPTKVSRYHSSVTKLTLHEIQIEFNIVQVSILT